MNNTKALIGFHLETSMHAGAGSQLDVIDLPIQRELPTEYPVVFGSAVKGALRAYAKHHRLTIEKDLFGPQEVTETASAGDMLVGDARLLLLPVRSLSTAFYWVTCPYILKRLNRDAERSGIDLGIDQNSIKQAESVAPLQVITATEQNLFLEENHFIAHLNPGLISKLSSNLAKLCANEVGSQLNERLVVVNDSDFNYLAKSATPVNPHVRLDSATKTTIGGALWYEETLPTETVLYSVIDIKNQRGLNSSEHGNKFKEHIQNEPYIQIGGNETVGMGWCKMQWLGAVDENS